MYKNKYIHFFIGYVHRNTNVSFNTSIFIEKKNLITDAKRV